MDNKINKVINYYNNYDEQARLSKNMGQIEFQRTQSIIRRYLKTPPATVLDVGGAAGRYSCWLAKAGYEVHLIDPVSKHLDLARVASKAQPEAPIASCTLGDARKLEFDDKTADAVLLLGPLYHLVEMQDRNQALLEAFRVLKPGGTIFAAAISRFASTIDGLVSGYYRDPIFQEIMRDDLESGQHRNPTNHPAYFTDAFFHRPDELVAEIGKAGFEVKGLFAVEGIVYLMEDSLRDWETGELGGFLHELITKIEEEPSLMGASPHLMCVGMKPTR
jgi:ubiquinone/menaquinone biosynthesis C-methylase UbiE